MGDRRMTTRSRASAAPAKITDVAANIQQASREAQATAAGSVNTRHRILTRKEATRELSEKPTIPADEVISCRNWMVTRENYLRHKLEGEFVNHDEIVTYEERREYSVIQALRIQAEDICNKLCSNRLTSSEISVLYEQLAAIMDYIRPLQNN